MTVTEATKLAHSHQRTWGGHWHVWMYETKLWVSHDECPRPHPEALQIYTTRQEGP